MGVSRGRFLIIFDYSDRADGRSFSQSIFCGDSLFNLTGLFVLDYRLVRLNRKSPLKITTENRYSPVQTKSEGRYSYVPIHFPVCTKNVLLGVPDTQKYVFCTYWEMYRTLTLCCSTQITVYTCTRTVRTST